MGPNDRRQVRLPSDRLRDPSLPLTQEDERWLAEDYPAARDGLVPEDFTALAQRLLKCHELPGMLPHLQLEHMALALAEGTPDLDDDPAREFLRAKEYLDSSDESPVPDPIDWTVRGVLSSPITLSLDSPVCHAFLVKKGSQVQEILVVGRGCGLVRRRLYDAAFLAALAAPLYDQEKREQYIRALTEAAAKAKDPAEADNLREQARAWATHFPADVLDGFIRLSRFAVAPSGGIPVANVAGMATDLNDPFVLLEEELRLLDRTSANLELHEVSWEQTEEFRARLVIHGLFYDKNNDPRRDMVVSVWPIHAEDETVAFRIPERLFDSEQFRSLRSAFLEAEVERTRVDADDRYRFFATQARDSREKLDKYHEQCQTLPPDELELVNQEEVRLDVKVDMATGTLIALREPKFVPRQEYYEDHLPELCENEESWRDRMKRILDNLAQAKQDGRLDRIITGYLLDSALRNLPALDGDAPLPGLADWQARVRPALLGAYRSALKGCGAAEPRQCRTRRVFFLFARQPWGRQAPPAPIVRPHYLFVNTTSVVDARHPVRRLADRIDLLRPGKPPAGARDTGELLGKALDPENTILKPLDRLAAIRQALMEDPQSTAEGLAKYFLARSERLGPPPGGDPRHARRVLEGSLSMLVVGAFHGAMRIVRQFMDKALAGTDQGDFALQENHLPELPCWFIELSAIVDEDPAPSMELVERWRAGGGADHIEEAFKLAEQWEPGFVDRWIASRRAGKGEPTSQAMRKAELSQDPTSSVPGMLDEVWDMVHAALELNAARACPREAVNGRRMYYLLGEALGRVMAMPKGIFVGDDVQELCDILLGCEHSQREKRFRLHS
jgi:hypothetical protein